jgi:hypothetical protein
LCRRHGPIWPELERHLVSGQHVADMSATFPTKSLSTTKAETYAGVTCVQDMLYLKNVLESLGLKVKLPMVLEMDNQGVVCWGL